MIESSPRVSDGKIQPDNGVWLTEAVPPRFLEQC